MGLCREHLNRQGSRKKAGTAVLLAVGAVLALFAALPLVETVFDTLEGLL